MRCIFFRHLALEGGAGIFFIGYGAGVPVFYRPAEMRAGGHRYFNNILFQPRITRGMVPIRLYFLTEVELYIGIDNRPGYQRPIGCRTGSAGG